MSDQFISAITDEAMARICYDGGWGLKPYKFLISQFDIFDGSSTQEPWSRKQAWDSGDEAVREALKGEAFEYLQKVVTENMQNDYTSGNVWYNARFSSVTKANETTLVHHVNIPGDVAIDTTSKTIKTIYFVYQDNAGQDFLYAVARCNSSLIFETGITQSFFFNFTVTNSQTQEMTEFILNYSCAHEIEDHNVTFGPEIHSNLVARDGSRLLSGVLKYNNISVDQFTDGDQLISKKYVDQYIKDYILPLMNNTICPPGKLDWWPGAPSTIPEGWAVRNGQLLSISANPKLYQLFGQKYKSECRSGTTYDTSKYFPLMNDCGLFIRGSELSQDGKTVQNTNLLNGVASGGIQEAGGTVTIPYNGYTVAGGHGTETYRKGWLLGVSGRSEIKEYLESIGAVLADRTLNLDNPHGRNRNYIPIIRLG